MVNTSSSSNVVITTSSYLCYLRLQYYATNAAKRYNCRCKISNCRFLIILWCFPDRWAPTYPVCVSRACGDSVSTCVVRRQVRQWVRLQHASHWPRQIHQHPRSPVVSVSLDTRSSTGWRQNVVLHISTSALLCYSSILVVSVARQHYAVRLWSLFLSSWLSAAAAKPARVH